MYIRVSELKNLTIQALDGDIGRCRDFLFDDQHWTVRYLELNTSRWLMGHKVLISPAAVGLPDFDNKRLPAELTRSAIEGAPGLEKDQPVSRAYEEEFARHYGHMHYWWGAGLWGVGPYPGDILVPGTLAEPVLPDDNAAGSDSEATNSIEQHNHLRSAEEVIGYTTHALDGDMGDVDDFILDTNDWSLNFAVLDTGRWLPGRKVILPVAWVSGISWAERSFKVEVTREALASAPEMEEPLTIEGIKAFFAHFDSMAQSGRGEPVIKHQ